ncbi:MAG: FKBP-type peptidyl-prolyl cis-trans isomerase [Solirubrobacterales bacterium]
MDSRVKTLIGAATLLVVVVVAVLIGRSGDDESEEPAAGGEKPTVEVPEGDPPAELEIEDLKEGDGDEAAAGDQLTVEYVGVLYDTGEEFDSSYDAGQPFEFVLGSGGVIPGWDEGLEGMKVGGQRQLVIPPDLAYGPGGQPPTIPPDSTLVFVIDLVAVN